MPEQTDAAPEGRTTVEPWVVTDDTGAFPDFVTRAFGGEEPGGVRTEDGSIGHGEIRIGDTVVPAFDRRPARSALPSLLTVFVVDADQACGRAAAAGGRVRHSGGRRRPRAAGRACQGPLRQHPVGDQPRRGPLRGRDGEAAAGPRVRRGDAGGPGDARRRAQRPAPGARQCPGQADDRMTRGGSTTRTRRPVRAVAGLHAQPRPAARASYGPQGVPPACRGAVVRGERRRARVVRRSRGLRGGPDDVPGTCPARPGAARRAARPLAPSVAPVEQGGRTPTAVFVERAEETPTRVALPVGRVGVS